jgi:hypothetical protein
MAGTTDLFANRYARNNTGTVKSLVFYAVHAEAMYQDVIGVFRH